VTLTFNSTNYTCHIMMTGSLSSGVASLLTVYIKLPLPTVQSWPQYRAQASTLQP